MRFTDRFIKFPIRCFNQEQFELTGIQSETDSYEMINPLHIASYRPSIDDSGNAVHVNFKDGTSILIFYSIQEFESILNKHYNYDAKSN
jgi:hypothetical protein